ncbi:nucleotidyltransferase family protein [Mesobacillus subterraneus]|uniref:nucleotidyltransferase domain-containing protein n=1 Tax=Mesobacillus subterraneus TaxID=285983 RepID=UPI00203B51EB|nr:nucleotidyltransferase family protein [Mesobacillus subterraneus]MCM3574680.1 nucleotidyltransferase family protein [Mesobacillus subterraneus]
MEGIYKLDLKDIPPELKLLIFILNSENEEDIYDELNSKLDIDWKLFLNLSFHHRVFPSIASKLKAIKANIVPEFVISNLNKAYRNNTINMLYLLGETEYISKLLKASHVPTLFLKGPSLAVDLYGDTSSRTSSDLDILVPIHQLEKAEEILIKSGYIKDDYFETVLNDWKWRHHHLSFFHPEKKVKVEVHWRLNPGPSFEPSFEDLWNRKRKCRVSSVNILGKEDLFVFLVTHGARHGWSRLRWLIDIHQLLEQKVDWSKVVSLFHEYHSVSLAGHAVILSSVLLKTNIPLEMQAMSNNKKSNLLAQGALFYFKDMINLHDESLAEEVAKYHRHYLFSQMSKPQKILFILSFFHPYPEDAAIFPLPKKFHYLYFPLRPFLWALRKGKKHAVV